MTDDPLAFGSSGYLWMFALLFFARGMDFLSTWIATPNLVLEGNPLAKKLGWKLGGIVNLALCATFAFWPLTAIIIATSGFLVAAHNFQQAWLMRSLGEENYRIWFLERISQTRLPLYLFCLLSQTTLTALVGAALVRFSEMDSVPFAIGLGILAFAIVVLFYTLLSVWRIRRRIG
jgi:hypothetical protein